MLGPISAPLDLHILLGGYKLVDDQVLESDLTGELSNAVHEIFTFSMDNITDVIKFALSLLITAPDLVDVLVFLLKLFPLVGEFLPEINL